MGSRETITAAITQMHDNDTLTSIRLLSGGEPEWTGEILAKHYPSPAKVEELLKGGDLIELVKEQIHCRYCKDDIEPWGDSLTKSHKSLASAFAKYNDEVDYIYIYSHGKWYCHKFKE